MMTKAHAVHRIGDNRREDYLERSLGLQAIKLAGPLISGQRLHEEIERLTGRTVSKQLFWFRNKANLPVLKVGRDWGCFRNDLPLLIEAIGLEMLPGVEVRRPVVEEFEAA